MALQFPISPFVAFLVVAVCIPSSQDASSSEFLPLGFFPASGTSSEALGVDDSGAVVVGTMSNNQQSVPFQLTVNETLSIFEPQGFASAVASDGKTVVGAAREPGAGFTTPFRWSAADGIEFLNPATPASFNGPSNATDVSADGSVIVGTSVIDGTANAFRWTEDDGLVDIGDLFAGSGTSGAHAVSANGEIIVGQSSYQGVVRAFRWKLDQGFTDLGDLVNGGGRSVANDISADGLAIVGSTSSSNGTEAFRWTEDGIEGLGFVDGYEYQSIATATTRLGQAVVGLSGIQQQAAFVWTEGRGMKSLQELLEEEFGLGESLSEWQLTAALDISQDGKAIVGRGINPDGISEAWLVRLEQPVFVPEPSAVSVLFLAVVFVVVIHLQNQLGRSN